MNALAQAEADVVLLDGRSVHLRPIRETDADSLREFHAGLSDRTIYFRYFAPKRELSKADLAYLTTVDYQDRFAFIALDRDDIVGVGRYDVVPGKSPKTAEIAFVIADDMQGRGLGSILLEHLAAVARERGVRKFEAEVLRVNQAMLATFTSAGYLVTTDADMETIAVEFDIAPTEQSLAVMYEREQRAERRNMEHLLTPSAVYVHATGDLGLIALRHIVQGGFAGPLGASWPDDLKAPFAPSPSITLQAFAAIVGAPIDLIVTDASMPELMLMLDDVADCGGTGIVALSDVGDHGEGEFDIGAFMEALRARGLRLIGPSALGLISPHISLNASLNEQVPDPGRIGFFCQSGALGSSILKRMVSRSLGLSNFISAGHRLDVSGNDALQYWESDEFTAAILLYLETLGNPQKLVRLVRQATKPIIMVNPPGMGSLSPRGHVVPHSALPARAVEAVLRNSGVIVAHSIEHMLDIASLFAGGRCVGPGGLLIITNSDALATIAMNFVQRSKVPLAQPPLIMTRTDERIVDALRDSDASSPAAVLILYVTPVDAPDLHHELINVSVSMHSLVCHVHTNHASTCVISGVPCFRDVEEALWAVFGAMSWERKPQPRVGVGSGPTNLTEECDLEAILGTVGLVYQQTIDVGPWDIELMRDIGFGPIMRIAPHQPLAESLGIDDTYGCPFTADSVNAERVFTGWGLLDNGMSSILAKLSWLLIDVPNIDRLYLSGFGLHDGYVTVSHWTVAFGDGQGRESARRMSTTYRTDMTRWRHDE
jgi:GNAT superfamily N-acetyltransferase